jgi:hypothetical protein
MKTLFKVSVFCSILYGVLLLPSLAPEKADNSTIINLPVVEQVEAKVAPIDASPAQLEVKPNDVTDGVWEWKPLVEQYFPKSEVINALRIMSAENGSGNPQVVSKPNRNGTKDFGLFQINTCHKNRVDGDLSRLLDAETNVKIASEIYSEQGFKPWSTAKKLGL